MFDHAPFLKTLDREASALAQAEIATRKAMTKELERAETLRIHAYRRKNVMLALVEAMKETTEEAEALRKGEAALVSVLGLAPGVGEDMHADISAAARPLLAAIDEVLNMEGDIDEDGPLAALAAFEHWYRDVKGAPLWTLLDRENTELPRLDHY